MVLRQLTVLLTITCLSGLWPVATAIWMYNPVLKKMVWQPDGFAAEAARKAKEAAAAEQLRLYCFALLIAVSLVCALKFKFW